MSSRRLELPIRDMLEVQTTDAELDCTWQRICATRRGRKGATRTWVWASACAAAACAALAITLGSTPGLSSLVGRKEPAFVAVDSAAPHELIADTVSQIYAFADGSLLQLAPSGQAVVEIEEPQLCLVRLLAGDAEFRVTHREHRRWVVDAGSASIEVTGTVFTVQRHTASLTIEVREGSVSVRSATLAGQQRQLAAGETLSLPGDDPASFETGTLPAAAPLPPADGRTHSARKALSAIATSSRAAPTANWRETAAIEGPAAAFAQLSRDGFLEEVARASSAADLLLLADLARAVPEPRLAVLALERLLALHPDAPDAALAAMTIGKLRLDALNEPALALQALRRATALKIPPSMREEVLARLVEASARTGDAAAAREYATDYLRQFPQGSYTRVVSEWLDSVSRIESP